MVFDIPHVFERERVEKCFGEVRDGVRVVGGLPDEHRFVLFDDMIYKQGRFRYRKRKQTINDLKIEIIIFASESKSYLK